MGQLNHEEVKKRGKELTEVDIYQGNINCSDTGQIREKIKARKKIWSQAYEKWQQLLKQLAEDIVMNKN